MFYMFVLFLKLKTNRLYSIKFLKIALTLLCIGNIHSSFSQNSKTTLKILSFNIHGGYTMEGDFDLSKAIKSIQEEKPDIVLLQEIDVRTKRAQYTDIATTMGYHTHLLPYFAKAIDFDSGYYGLAILSKFPVISSKIYPLINNTKAEARIAQELQLNIPNYGKLRIVNTHLDFTNKELNYQQTQQLHDWFTDDIPTILGGDFNQTPDQKGIALLQQNWTMIFNLDNYTYPSQNPQKKIDYLFIRSKKHWKIIEKHLIPFNGATDHLGLSATLEY